MKIAIVSSLFLASTSCYLACAQGDDPSAVVDRLFDNPSVVKCLSICGDINNVDARAECRDSCFETDNDNATGPTSEPKV